MSLRLRVLPPLLAAALAAPAADPIPLPRFAAAPRALSWQAPQPPATAQRYKLTVVEDASTFRRAARGRASSEAVVKVTDENDRPVAGIVVTFSMPQLTGASFSSGALTVTSTTSSTGLASAGVNVSTSATTNFSISVTASVPGSTLTASIPVSVAAAAAVAATAGGGGGGLSGGTLALIVAAVGGGAAAGIYAATRGGNDPRPNPTPNPGTSQPPAGIRIGIGGGVSVIPGQ
ncbi:MAG: hypothetical protein JNK87_42815 [Bryobacterales bacterium]|nr:hypothetical protein [Bryobacterales bacterium]